MTRLMNLLAQHIDQRVLVYYGLNGRGWKLDLGRGKVFFLKERYAKGLRHEKACLEMLAPKRFPFVPACFGVLRCEEGQFLVQEYVDGKSLEGESARHLRLEEQMAEVFLRIQALRRGRNKPASIRMKEYGRFVMTVLLRLRSSLHDSRLTDRARIEKHVVETGVFVDKLVSGEAVKAAGNIREVFVNGEPNFFLGKNGKLYCLDWGGADLGDAAWPLAGVLSKYFFLDSRKFLEACFSGCAENTAAFNRRVAVYKLVHDFLNNTYVFGEFALSSAWALMPAGMQRKMLDSLVQRQRRVFKQDLQYIKEGSCII